VGRGHKKRTHQHDNQLSRPGPITRAREAVRKQEEKKLKAVEGGRRSGAEPARADREAEPAVLGTVPLAG
jgi:hypothetical protein